MEAIYTNEEAARAHLERLLWPAGPVCPHCGVIDNATPIQAAPVKVTRANKAGVVKTKEWTRQGIYRCGGCAEQFSVTTGTVFESSHIPLTKWVLGAAKMNASKKGISALQLQRELELGSYRTAWFMAMRLREMMRGAGIEPLGGAGKIVEADETYYGKKQSEVRTQSKRGKPYKGKGGGPANKRAVVALVERGGQARMFHVADANKETVAEIIRKNVDPASRLHTDESRLYVGSDAHTATHETTKHSAGEYVRGDVHSNSAEGFFGVFKKGMTGVYQHCDEKYLSRYLDEFEFRHNNRAALGVNDKERAARAIRGAAGKRLTLRHPKSVQA